MLVKETDIKSGDFIEDVEDISFCIQCRIVPITQKERNMLPLGRVTTGSMTGYFLPSYDFRGVSYEVQENDIINDKKNDVTYRILKIIQREHLNYKVVYIKGLLQKI
jgi:hypothetical protein